MFFWWICEGEVVSPSYSSTVLGLSPLKQKHFLKIEKETQNVTNLEYYRSYGFVMKGGEQFDIYNIVLDSR